MSLFLEEIVQIFFADSVDPTKLDALEFFTAYKLQYGQVMELQGLCDLFGREEPLDHSIELSLTWSYLILFCFALQCFYLFLLNMY